MIDFLSIVGFIKAFIWAPFTAFIAFLFLDSKKHRDDTRARFDGISKNCTECRAYMAEQYATKIDVKNGFDILSDQIKRVDNSLTSIHSAILDIAKR